MNNRISHWDEVLVGNAHNLKAAFLLGGSSWARGRQNAKHQTQWLIMASPSGHGYKSNRNYRQWLTETFDGHETADDELSDNLDGNDNIIQPSLQAFSLTSEPLEPFIGMEFESAEDAREFYEISHRLAFSEDEKDLKIRELTTELHREKKKSAAYQQQLQLVLKYVEDGYILVRLLNC
nr:hypothetical protein CFP56_10797 [Quercus suber]